MVRPGINSVLSTGASRDAPAHWSNDKAALHERLDVGLLYLQGDATARDFRAFAEHSLGAAPPTDRRLLRLPDFSLARVGPRQWYVSGRVDAIDDLMRVMEPETAAVPCHIADLTHGVTVIDIDGAGAVSVVNQSCGLDTRLAVTPVGTATRTRFADIGCYLERNGDQAFRVLCDRPLGTYLWRWLVVTAERASEE